MKRHLVLGIVTISSIVLLSLACKKNDAETPPSFAPAYPQASAQPTATAPAPSATSSAPPGQVQPTAIDPAIGHIISAQLIPIASKDARGMKPVGSIMAAMLQQGQFIEQNATLQPGKCYTVIGLGMPTIQELDIVIAPLIPLQNAPALPLAQDNQTGAQATVAPQPNCYKYVLPLPMQVKIIATAKAGSGPVGAQLYEK